MLKCRICLSPSPDKYVYQLTTSKKCGSKDPSEILLFCLNIQISDVLVTEEKLCTKCFTKTLSFYKFKMMALRNDSYLKSVNYSDPKLSVDSDDLAKTIKNEVLDGLGIDELEHINFNQQDIITQAQSNAISKNDISVKSENDHEMKFKIIVGNEIGKVKCEVLIDEDEWRESDEDSPSTDESDDYDLDEYLETTIDEDFPEDSLNNSIDSSPKKSTKSKQKKKRKLKKQETSILAKPGICDLCGANVKNLETHALVHLPKSERKLFPCTVCSKSFLTRSAKSRHNSLAHLGKVGHCEVCNRDYMDLKSHTLTVHNPQQLPYECGVCFMRFPYSSYLEKHMRRHTKEKPFQCETCGKEFRLKHLLDNHVRCIHDQERKFSCTICAKSFFKKGHLDRHTRSHTKEKPFICNDCGQSYSTRESLRVHQVAAHSNSRNYACNLCEKAFKTQSTLCAHKKTHTNEKPFLCPHCHARYARLFDMQRHVLKNHQHHINQTSPGKMDDATDTKTDADLL